MNQETRILLLSPSLDLRGTTVHTRNLVRALRDRGYKFHVVARPGTLARALTAEGAIIHPFPVTPGLNTWLNLPRLSRLIGQIQPHILHVRHHTLLRLARPLLWRHPLPLIVSVSTPPAAGPLPLPRSYTRAVLAVSDPLAQELVAAHRVPRSLLSTIRDATFVSDTPTPIPTTDHPIIGYMGRLEKDRGIHLIPKVASLVLERHPQARFALVGEGKDDLHLRRWIRKANLCSKVHVAPPPADYRKILEGFTVLLSPSLTEGLGIFALEAMAVGRPVVASAVGGVYGHVKDGRTGLLAKAGDVDDMASRICEIIEEPLIAEALGKNARELMAADFGLEEFAKEIDQVYRHALAFRPQETKEDEGL